MRVANGALSRFNPAQPGAQGMKVVATGLLVAMAVVFAVCALGVVLELTVWGTSAR